MLYHVIQYSLVLVICTYLVQYYSAKSVSWHIRIWSIITWTLNFAIALLVPQDVYHTLTSREYREMQQSEHMFTPIGWQYLVLYWLVYLLTWTVIPVLQEWENSGDLESQNRLKRSLKTNGVFYLQMLVGAVLFLGFLIFMQVQQTMGLVTFLKCLATIWGLLLLMCLLGYALVEIPKTLWVNSEPRRFLLYLYGKVVQVEDELEASYQDFIKVTGFILYSQRHCPEDPQVQRYCSESLKLVPTDYEDKINHKNYHQFLESIDYIKDYPVGLESSIEHHRLLKRTIAQCRRTERTFEYYCRTALLYQDIIKSSHPGEANQRADLNQALISGSQENEAGTHNLEARSEWLTLKTELFDTKWYHSLWYLYIRRPFNKALAVVIGTCSVLMLICQTQVFLSEESSLLGWLLRIKDYETLRLLIFVIIVFIVYMVNYSLFRLKLANIYGLYPKDSDGPSMMFATINFSRVGVVIVLNFFDMMKMDSEYRHVMGTVDMGLLGEWVIKGLPGVLWLIVLTHYFNVWGRLINRLKLSDGLAFNTHEVANNDMGVKAPYAVLKKRKNIGNA